MEMLSSYKHLWNGRLRTFMPIHCTIDLEELKGPTRQRPDRAGHSSLEELCEQTGMLLKASEIV